MSSLATNVQTPFGLARYPFIDREEERGGVRTDRLACGICFTGAELAEMRALVEAFIQRVYPPERAGAVIRPFRIDAASLASYLKFTCPVLEPNGQSHQVVVVDQQGVRIEPIPRLGAGSLIQIRGLMEPVRFFEEDHVRLTLQAVKVHRLIEDVPGGPWPLEMDGGWVR
jgi:hypothetical protein